MMIVLRTIYYLKFGNFAQFKVLGSPLTQQNLSRQKIKIEKRVGPRSDSLFFELNWVKLSP